MQHTTIFLSISFLFGLWVQASQTFARTIAFSGHNWTVRNADLGGPGPNTWDERNVWVDEQGHLHLKVAYRDGKWSCAELIGEDRLGFGTYQFKIIGRPDLFDANVVLGLFSYTRPDVGPDGTHEIDIEFSRWGDPKADVGNWTVFPAVAGVSESTQKSDSIEWHLFELPLPSQQPRVHQF